MTETKTQTYNRIVTGLKSWKDSTNDAAKLILEAQEKEVWKDNFSSFKEFLEKECGISRQWGYKLAEYAGTIKELSDSPSVASRDTESGKSLDFLDVLTPDKAVTMKGLSADKKVEVLEKAIVKAKGKSPTVKTIKETVSEVKDTEKKPVEIPIVLDVDGKTVPPELHDNWHRSIATSKELVSNIQHVLNTFRHGVTESDLIFREFTNTIFGQIEGLRYSVKSHLGAYALCPKCNGINPKKCDTCAQRGFLSKYFYESPAYSAIVRQIKREQL